MADARFSADRIESLVADFNRDGFCILPGFLKPELIQSWAAAFAPLLTYHLEHFADASFRGANRHYVTLPFVAPYADPVVFDNDDALALVERIVGEDFTMCQLATDTPLFGSDYQNIHSDAPPLFPETQLNTPSFQLALNFPLCDVTKDNGPLDIVRGTHTMQKESAMAKIESGELKIESIAMKAGDVMIRDVRTLHRGTPNRTHVPRPMVVVGYSRKWLMRPEVSIQIPQSTWAKLSPRARHMLRFNPIVDEISKMPAGETYKAFAY